MPHMKTTAERPGFVTSTIPRIAAWPSASALFFFALLWLEVIRHLRTEWSLNPQYGYGWSVPFLVLYLFWKRWPVRPSPEPTNSRGALIALSCLLAFLFLPIRVIVEANPDWRLLSWALALLAVALSICFVFLVGGRPWLRHFAFPILFFLVAVPWPTQLEQAVVQNLMRAVATVNVSMLNIVGVPALQHGNVIEISSGLIGIEEACSGVRSLQATLMISLFLGELYSFTISRRFLLVVVGALLAFFCNLVRTALLVWIGVNHGINAIEAWHDPAGLTILLVCLFGLWLCSLIMQRNSAADVLPSSPDKIDSVMDKVPRAILAALAAWILLAEIATQIWYGAHRPPAIVAERWSVQWPTSRTDYKDLPVTAEAQNLLRYNEGGGGRWRESPDHSWNMFFFRWLPGRTAALFVKNHRPDICLPAAGLTMRDDKGISLITVKNIRLPIHAYRFDAQGEPLHVFYCYWDGRSSYGNAAAAQEEDWTATGRLRAAWKGRRDVGTQMLELAVWGYENDNEANAALLQQLEKIISPG
ncbi:MAG: hypothetical protein QOI04_1221 [Verrucomicrobiota bacterium]|jgi:exosortase